MIANSILRYSASADLVTLYQWQAYFICTEKFLCQVDVVQIHLLQCHSACLVIYKHGSIDCFCGVGQCVLHYAAGCYDIVSCTFCAL